LNVMNAYEETGVLWARRPWVQLRFSLLADFQQRSGVARRYGVYRDGQGRSARARFVFDRQRVIRCSQADPDAINPGVDALLTTLEWLVAEHHEPGHEHATGR
jgi:alkyl hydroperoxide reductase subunit AhpC